MIGELSECTSDLVEYAAILRIVADYTDCADFKGLLFTFGFCQENGGMGITV